MSKQTIFLSFLLLFSPWLHGATVIKGDAPEGSGQSFTVPVFAHDYNPFKNTFYVGAQTDGAGKYTISRYMRGNTNFVGLTPSQTRVNNIDSQVNPLFDKSVSILTALLRGSERLGVVLTDEPSNLYVIEDIFSASVLSYINVKDATGQNVTGGILGLHNILTTYIFAPVLPSVGTFGDPGSGIAILGVADIVDEQGESTHKNGLVQVDVNPNEQTNPLITRAIALDRTTDQVKITDDLAVLENAVCMFWDLNLKRLYIGVQGQAGTGGIKGIAIGRFAKNSFVLENIAPDAAFSGSADKIIGATGVGEAVSIHNLAVMRTSTFLNYLIVHGNNGLPANTRRSVFALPLNDYRDNKRQVTNETLQGTIAARDAVPEDLFTDSDVINHFAGRQFRTPATDSTDMFTNSDPEVTVGGGPIAVGDIEHIAVSSDTVFVSVAIPDTNQIVGIFYSQALFDAHGRISGWTNWRRVGGTTDGVFGFRLGKLGNFIFLSGSDPLNINTVKITEHGFGASDGLGPLVGLVNNTFKTDGVHGFSDFVSTPSDPYIGINNIGLHVVTGGDTVLLVEAGTVTSGVLTPQAGNFVANKRSFENGTITQTLPTQPAPNDEKVITISGGVLSEIGPLCTAVIAGDTTFNEGFLFVGGANGVAILNDSLGQGWDLATGLGTGFQGLAAGMSFKKISDHQQVKKLSADGDFLYILTDKVVDRIALNNITDNPDANLFDRLATITDFIDPLATGSFFDLIISEKLAVLATSVGVYRIGNNKDVTTVTDFQDANWQRVVLNEINLPAVQLFAISKTGREIDVARNGGNLYVLGADRGNNRARLYRFAIADTTLGAIDDNTVMPFPDMSVQDIPSYYASLGEFFDYIYTDGSVFLSSKNSDLSEPVQLRVGFRANAILVPLQIDQSATIVNILRSFSSGSWLVAGDFGLRVNE